MNATGYEKLTDRQFWSEAAKLLSHVDVSGLADYVHAEAERRDSSLAANKLVRIAMIEAAGERAPFDVDDLDTHFTSEEDAKFNRLVTAYNERFTALAHHAC